MKNDKIDIKFEVIEVLENVAVIYQKGREEKEFFNAIHVNRDGIFIGYILKKDDENFYEEFVEFGYIPNQNIKRIERSKKRKVYKRKI